MITLHNARLLTMDAAGTQHPLGWLRIDGELIVGLGAGEPPPLPDGATEERVDLDGDLLMPGMVNSHCHLPMTLFRGLGEDVDDRLFRYVLPLERRCITPRTVRTGTELATLECIRAGVTTLADMYWFEHTIGQVIDECGLRGIVGQTIATFPTPDQTSVDEGFALVDALVDAWQGHARVTPSIAPHAPYSTGIQVMQRVAEWADAHPQVPVQLHMAEMVSEMEWAEREHGLRPVGTVDKAGLLRDGLIAAHCLFVDDSEMDLMAERGVRVAHNARSNAKAGRGIAPVEALRTRGIPVGIATDGPMSGNTLDLFAQFGPVSMFQKLAGNSRAPMPAHDVVRMATSEAAAVLGLQDRIGSLEPGKQADLIRVSLQDPRVQPVWDVYATLVFACSADDVRDTMVAGRWLMRDRQVLTLESSRVLADVAQVVAEFGEEMITLDQERNA